MEVLGQTHGESSNAADVARGGFDDFVRLHFDPLARALSMITLDKGLAADAAQDAFLRVHLRWQEIDTLDDPVAWLYRVAINRSRDYRRQLRRAAKLFDRLTAQAVVEGDTGSGSGPWVPEVGFANLVRQLPRQQRVAAVLYYEADLSTAEIARVMRMSEGAVKSHLHRARESLRPLLEAER
jgi:DNA-directed RNA polymerase specialized sigma24 family protein